MIEKRILITQCTDNDNWYENDIGKKFILAHKFANYYWVRYTNAKGNPCMNTVNIKDAKEL